MPPEIAKVRVFHKFPIYFWTEGIHLVGMTIINLPIFDAF